MYGIGNMELLAIVACLEKWQMYLHGIQFMIFTDHHNLQNFATKALLNRRQARWVGLLPQYEFQLQFRPGKANGKADALTHRSEDLPCEGDGRGRPKQDLIPPRKSLGYPDLEPEPSISSATFINSAISTSISSTKFINSAILCNSTVKHNPNIRTALTKDELAIIIMKARKDGSKGLTGK